jgi:hypothetical protein
MSLNTVTIITTAADHGLSQGEEVYYGREVYYARVLDARRLVLYADTALTTVVSDPGAAEYIIGRDQYPVITIFPRSQFTDDGRGILGAFIFDPVITANVTEYNLRTAALAAGWDGNSIIYATVTVAAGVYVYATTTNTYGFDTGTGYPDNSRIELINNGFIIGQGGDGGDSGGSRFGRPGGPAMNIRYPVSITNNSYIAGGGGGGGSAGGGGAGGGRGGPGNFTFNPLIAAGGGPGQAGQTLSTSFGVGGIGGGAGGGGGGVSAVQGQTGTVVGGGGGRILPGVGGAGGGNTYRGGDGGSSNGNGGAGGAIGGGGGGGGWGATGGAGGNTVIPGPGGVGGKAINLNGITVTISGSGQVWGAIS